MLPKAKRLTRSDFSKHPIRSVAFTFGSIKVLDGGSKAAVVVSKKISAKAVSRNALRRRVYAILRDPIRKGRWQNSLIVYPNRKAAAASFRELKEELERALAHC